MIYLMLGLVIITLLKVMELIRMCSDMNQHLNIFYKEFTKLVYTELPAGATGEADNKKSGVLEVSAKEYREMMGLK